MEYEDAILWDPEPVWNEKREGWCWQGTNYSGKGKPKSVTWFLGPGDFGADGYPRPGLKPPLSSSSGAGSHASSSYEPRSAAASNQSGYAGDQLSLIYPISSSPLQGSGNYSLESGSLSQGRPGQNQAQGPFDLDSQAAFSSSYQHGGGVSGSGQKTSDQLEATQAELGVFSNSSTYDGAPSHSKLSSEYQSATSTPTREKHGHHKKHRSDNKPSTVQSYPPDFGSKHSKHGSGKQPAGLQSISHQGGGAYYGSTQFSSSHNANAGTSSMALYSPSHSFGAQIPEIRVSRRAEEKAPVVGKNKKSGDKNSPILDPAYVIHPSSDFQAGKILSIMWFEPKGASMKGAFGSRITHQTTLAEHKKSYWAGFRRFLVIRSHQGHSTCVPIYTYKNQGCNKPGVKHSQHGVVYEDGAGKTGALLPGETPLGFPPIRAQTTHGNILEDASRVNYSRLATIPHNKEVLFLADVLSEDWPIVTEAIKSFFELCSR